MRIFTLLVTALFACSFAKAEENPPKHQTLSPINSQIPTNPFERLRKVSRLAWLNDAPLLPRGDSSLDPQEAQQLGDIYATATQDYQNAEFGVVKYTVRRAFIAQLEAFLASHPDSAYVPGVHVVLGAAHKSRMHYSTALEHYRQAWEATRELVPNNPSASQIAEAAASGLAELLVFTGQENELPALEQAAIATFGAAPRGGGWQWAKEAFQFQHDNPQEAFDCGLYCVQLLGRQVQPGNFNGTVLQSAPTGPDGLSAAQLVAAASQAGLPIRHASLTEFSVIPTPSVVHLKTGHFIFLQEQRGAFYRVMDPLLSSARFLTAEDIAIEASGCVLVSLQSPANAPGFSKLSTMNEAEASVYIGRLRNKRIPDHLDPGGCQSSTSSTCPTCPEGGGTSSSKSGGTPESPSGKQLPKNAGNSGKQLPKNAGANSSQIPYIGDRSSQSGSSCAGCGMVTWFVSEPFLNLWAYDIPLEYEPPIGPTVRLSLAYTDRREAANDGSFDYYGAKLGGDFTYKRGFWTCSWFLFAVPDSTGYNVDVSLPSGGKATFTFALGETTAFDYRNRIQLEQLFSGATFVGYRLHFPDGTYGDYTSNVSGNYFITTMSDVSGNSTSFTYSGTTGLLTTVTAADGVTFSLTYDSTLTDFVNSITSSTLSYTVTFTRGETGPNSTAHASTALTGITDVAGIKSQVFYRDEFNTPAVSGYVEHLVTPYGRTTFVTSSRSTNTQTLFKRYVRVTYPDSTQDLRAMLDNDTTGTMPTTFTGAQTPDTSDAFVNGLDTSTRQYFNTLFWNRQQFSGLTTTFLNDFNWDDFKLATLKHWLDRNEFPNDHYDTLSYAQLPSPDGTTEGAITWYDYAAKPLDGGGAMITYQAGTNIWPSVVAQVMPDGTTTWKSYDRNAFGLPTTTIEKWVSAGSAQYRTNTYVYEANLVDLSYHIGPDGVPQEGYGYDQATHPHLPLRMTNALNEITTYTYVTDGTHRLSTKLTPAGLLSTFTYGADKYVDKIVDSISGTPLRTNLFTWIKGNLRTTTDPRGLMVTNTYDNLNRLTKVDYPDGTCERNIYYIFSGSLYSNSTGETNIIDLTGRQDRLTNWTYFAYNSLRQLAAVTNALGNVTTFDYCYCGGLASVTEGYGTPVAETTSYTYDQQGNRLTGTMPDGSTYTNRFDLWRRQTNALDLLSNTTFWYDNLGRGYASSNAMGQISKAIFDINDRLISSTDANGVTVTNSFDKLGRPLSHKNLSDNGTEYFFYATNFPGVTAYTNQTGSVTLYAYDAALRTTNVTQSGIYTNSFTYSPADDLLTLADGNGNTTTWGYQIYGLAESKKYATGGTNLTYFYDARGQLTNRWSAAFGNTKYKYDAVGNLTNIDYPASADVRYKFDAINRITNMVDGIGTTVFAFNNALLKSEDGPFSNDTVSYAYNGARQRSQLVIQLGASSTWTNTYAYDSATRLTNVTSPAGSFSTYYVTSPNGVTAPSALVLKRPLLGGAVITNTFDTSGRLTDTTLYGSGSTILNRHGYKYTVANLRSFVSRTNSANSGWAGYLTNIYDAAFELTSALTYDASGSAVSGQQFGFAYDHAWNMTNRTTGASTTGYTVNSLNQITAGGGSYTYDSNGNMLSDAGGLNYLYDDENRLATVYLTNSWKFDFTYDGFGRLRKAFKWNWKVGDGIWLAAVGGDIRYIYDGRQIVQERNSSLVPLVTYTRGADFSSSLEAAGGIGGLLARSVHNGSSPYAVSSSAFYHADDNGNITAMVDSTPALVASYQYDPFGRTLSSSGTLAAGNVMRFSSKPILTSSASLYYYGYRFYNSENQRWVNRDPIEEEGGVNLYAFVGNDPVNLVDPYGLDAGGRVGPGFPHDGYGSPDLGPSEARRKCIDQAARGQNGSTAWAYDKRKDGFAPGQNKCNKFVFDVIKSCGAGKGTTKPGSPWPLQAGDWADPKKSYGFWRPLRPGESPGPGDVAAYKLNGGAAYSGHTGFIVSGPDGPTNISAHHNVVGPYYNQFLDGEYPTTFHRYVGP